MSGNIKQIFHPTYFYKPAQNAFTYARKIAPKNDAKLPYAYGSEILMPNTVYDGKYKDLHIEPAIEFGDTVTNILNFSCDSIVMGSTGKTKMGKILFGSISSEVMLKSDMPVLIVPADRPYSNFNRMVFATDYRNIGLEILKKLAAWAKLFEAEIAVLHIAAEDNPESSIKFRSFKEIAGEEVNDTHQ